MKHKKKNIVYEIELGQLKPTVDKSKLEQYKYEDGYLILHWSYEGANSERFWHGFVTPEELKEVIGPEQYEKFKKGKRKFIIKNI